MIPTALSSALCAMNFDDQDLGGVCIDLGESSTSISVFENKKLIFCDSISIGSKNITKDIARGISTTIESAERLKLYMDQFSHLLVMSLRLLKFQSYLLHKTSLNKLIEVQ